jgi:catechol 2,3-dioxygenase-like lactoylglutathione lyase family enzyme
MSAITHLFAGVPVSDLDVSIDWYTRFFGRPPDMRVGEEILWEIDERAWLFIEPNAARAGAGRITLSVAGLDALLERLAAQRIEHEPIETYSNGVRHVNIPDPDGNAIAFAEPAQRRERVTSIGRTRGFVVAQRRCSASFRRTQQRHAAGDVGCPLHAGEPWVLRHHSRFAG